jgi:Response regulator containing CheY-like receiver domain and AraC-type DNA-binding domain
MKILIVEDEYNAREGLAELIIKTSPEHTVCGKAANGQEGYDMAVKYRPDLAFVDIELPKMTGLEMIEKLRQTPEIKSDMPAFVILSGYAEFRYAQQAIQYGVQDYLLKPISYEKLKTVIRNLAKLNELKNTRGTDSTIKRDMILSSILQNDAVFSREALRDLDAVHLPGNRYLLTFYYGKNTSIEALIQAAAQFCQQYDFSDYYISIMKDDRLVPLLITTDKPFTEIEKIVNYNLIYTIFKAGFRDCTVTLIPVADSGTLCGMKDSIKTLNSWALSLGNEKAISPELVEHIHPNNTALPRQFDIEALYAIKNNAAGDLKRINKEFIDFLKLRQYTPSRIIRACTSYAFSVLVCYQELNVSAYDRIQDFHIFDVLKNCCTPGELLDCLNNITDMYTAGETENCHDYSLSVRKIINYISASYSSDISLEHIAEKMGITPDYLSHLFTKEVGVSFSTYIKKYRIGIAKKMMLDSACKIREIGEKTGYGDPKYFSKVFREVTGLSPREYIRMKHP